MTSRSVNGLRQRDVRRSQAIRSFRRNINVLVKALDAMTWSVLLRFLGLELTVDGSSEHPSRFAMPHRLPLSQ